MRWTRILLVEVNRRTVTDLTLAGRKQLSVHGRGHVTCPAEKLQVTSRRAARRHRKTWQKRVKHGGAPCRSHCVEHRPRLDALRQGHPRSLEVTFSMSDPVRWHRDYDWLTADSRTVIHLSLLLSSLLLLLLSLLLVPWQDTSRHERCCADASVVHCTRSYSSRLPESLCVWSN